MRHFKCLFVFSLLFFYSCSKNDNSIDKFTDKVWIIDSIEARGLRFSTNEDGGKVLMYPNTILKPKKDSSMDLYKDQYLRFKNFYFSEDTIFISKRYNGRQIENQPFKYFPYSYKFTEDKLILKALDSNEKYKVINLTDLTTLFSSKNEIRGQKFYESLKTDAWYPVKYELMDSVFYENNTPNYYITKRSFIVQNNKLNVPYYFDKDSSLVYKISDENLYIYDSIKNSLVQSFQIKKFQNDGYDMMKLSGFDRLVSINITLKKIDRTLLINEKDLPKKVRLGCNEFMAEWQLNVWLKENVNYEFYFDMKTLNLTRQDDENCIYYFNVIMRSKEFQEISSKKNFKVEYLENGDIQFTEI